MALVPCCECKKEISSNTKACPYCGAPPKSSSGCAVAFLICAALALLVMCVSPKTPSGPESPKAIRTAANAKKAESAYYRARRMIELTLKAPSTAKFSALGVDGSTGYKMDDDGSIRAYGYVDAQNGFGAMLRHNWQVDFSPAGTVVKARLGSQDLLP